MLQERGLLSELGPLVAQVRAYREAVLNVTVQGHLVREVHVLQDVLRFPPLLCWEDRVCLSSGDAERSNHSLQLLGINEGWVGHAANVDTLALRTKAGDVLGAEAVSYGTDLLDAHRALHLLDDGFHDGVHLAWTVALALRAALAQPCHEVKAFGLVQRDRVTFKQVRHHDKVAIGGELVCNELGVDELVAYDVRQNQNGVLRGLALRVREDGLGVLTLANVLHLSLGSAFMLDTNGAAASAGVGGHLVCVCLGSRA
ncbi:hypothetical protein KC345_g251 [Hortaea werneckii]|nr:hypothetical protein KC345_g251 [Hortaea werneckii]